jgi:hypothetical protein
MKAVIGASSSPNFTSMPPEVISVTVAVTVWPLRKDVALQRVARQLLDAERDALLLDVRRPGRGP